MKKIERAGYKKYDEVPEAIKTEILKHQLIRRINKSLEER